ncbi:hypothetical protein MRB53_024503 [Persea americana]|uniref:Uncharacterized protein n=1 Tax=Persea americana TaxID=3435 RepID=A0ACC2LCY2_PERAE|nr:hypothetical protein MRB53_024503 [Persea americana]
MFSPIHEGNWPSMLKLLRQKGPRWSIVHPVPTAQFKGTIVHAAAALGKTEVVKERLWQMKEMNIEMGLEVFLGNQLSTNQSPP